MKGSVTAIIEACPEGGYWAFCPEIPGANGQGEVAGPEVLRRILGGSEITRSEYHGRYYHKSLKAKKLIEEEFENILWYVVVCCGIL